jgi:Histidine kinase
MLRVTVPDVPHRATASATATAPSAAPDADGAHFFPWRAFGLRGLRNQVLCAGIALLIWLIGSGGRGNLFTAWVYSAAIGTCCWALIDGGRLLLSRWLTDPQRPLDARRAHWPGPRWMALCIVLGTVVGYTLGTAIGDAVTGFTTPSLLQNRTALVISLIVAVATTWYFYATERLSQEQANAESARRAAAESQLQSQLEPHMLFNTLANLRVLVTLDPPRAQAMLDRLISYLRATLGASRQDLHALATEFTMLDDYLALMSMRMGPRLQVRLSLPEALRDLPVPPLLLQPLVENCIRHGLEPKVAGGRIEVQARLQDGHTGVGLAASTAGPGRPGLTPAPIDRPGGTGGTGRNGGTGGGTEAGGYGTSHVAERLQALYGGAARFRLTEVADAEGGTLAEVLLPRPVDPAASR